jgi:glycine/D-amino acid oxidase-like deaminating enzyme
VLVKGEAKVGATHIFPSENGELLYVIPRPMSGTTILGGCKQSGNWDPEEDKELTQRILERAKGLEESKRLLQGNGEFEVMSVQVGRRPGRKGGPRVEMEKEKVCGIKLIYAYGHSGSGYQNSIGSAAKVVGLLNEKSIAASL